MTQPPSNTDLIAQLHGGDLAGGWILDGELSSVTLRSSSMWGLAKVNGAFTDLAGRVDVTPDGGVTASVQIGAASIDTRQNKRDQHLRSADFFDADQHPAITFTLRSLEETGDGLVANGDLTVRDITKPCAVPVTADAGDGALTVSGQVTLDRREYGMTWNQMGMASTSNAIAATLHFVRTA